MRRAPLSSNSVSTRPGSTRIAEPRLSSSSEDGSAATPIFGYSATPTRSERKTPISSSRQSVRRRCAIISSARALPQPASSPSPRARIRSCSGPPTTCGFAPTAPSSWWCRSNAHSLGRARRLDAHLLRRLPRWLENSSLRLTRSELAMKFRATVPYSPRGPDLANDSFELHRRRFFRLAAAAPAASILTRCSALERDAPMPAALADQVTVLGIQNARFWPDTQGEALVREGVQASERERTTAGMTGSSNGGPTAGLPPAYFLAVSGGGDDGAFGAGLLCGWADSGKMPKFKLVTGVSTGAMIAPFPFLGGAYTDRLRTMYTSIKPDDISEDRALYGALFGEALADTTPLYRLISRYVDEQMLADIAREYESGRLLLIGTTSLDEQRPIIWNIGAIAASGRPGALELFRKVLLASAAVPGAFPPVMIEVDAGGRRYQEMNVD